MIDEEVRRIFHESLRLKSPGDAARFNAGIARSHYIYGTVAHHQCPVALCFAFRHERLNTDGMRLLPGEAVATVNAPEMGAKPETRHNGFAEADGLIGKDGHGDTGGEQPVQSFADAGVKHRIVQHVFAIIRQKKIERALRFVVRSLWPQRLSNQNGSAITYVRINSVVRKRGHAEVRARSVNGVGKVEFGIDQSAIQIEDHEVGAKAISFGGFHSADIIRFAAYVCA